jgi:hypothetical protein
MMTDTAIRTAVLDLKLRIRGIEQEIASLERRYGLVSALKREPATVEEKMVLLLQQAPLPLTLTEIAKAIGVPNNTISVTIIRNPDVFQRISWGRYQLKRGR